MFNAELPGCFSSETNFSVAKGKAIQKIDLFACDLLTARCDSISEWKSAQKYQSAKLEPVSVVNFLYCLSIYILYLMLPAKNENRIASFEQPAVKRPRPIYHDVTACLLEW